MKKTLGIVVMAFSLGAMAQGQPEKNVGSVEIDVVDQYKASIKKATKISNQPDFVDTTTKKLPIQYRIFPELLQFTYKPEPITPIRVQGVRLGKLPHNTIKLGAGMYGSSLAEILLSSSRAEAFNWEVGLNHEGSIKGVKNIVYDRSPYMENTLFLGGRWLLKDYRLKAKAGVDWNRYHYYGVPDSPESDSLQVPELETNDYQRYFGSVTFDRVYRQRNTPFQSAGISYHYFNNNWLTKEQKVKATTAWQLPKEIENHLLGAQLNLDWQKTIFGVTNTTINQLNVQFFPKAKGKYGWFGYTLGLNFNFYNIKTSIGATTTNSFLTYFYPEVAVEAELVRDVLAFFAGWTGDVTMNGQYNLTMQNPYLVPGAFLSPTGSQKIFGGLEGAVARNISYKAEANLRYVTSMPLFYRSGDSLTIPYYGKNLPAFDVIYVRGSIFQVRGELSYHAKNTQVAAYGEFFSYQLKDDDTKVRYHLPKLRVGFDVLQIIREKFEVKAGLAFIGGREALNTDGTIYKAKMKDIWDLHLSVGYNINNNLSAGLEFSNLASQNYQIWLGYPVQRFRALLFLRYSF